MDIRFQVHNSHRESPDEFKHLDPHLRQLARQPYVHDPHLLHELPSGEPGIYSLGGGRQVGKTTLLKMWMARLLDKGVSPERITFITGEVIDDHHALLGMIEEVLGPPSSRTTFLAIDEVTYIRDWDRAVKFAADAGLLENTVLIITGSDLTLMTEARKRFPGRRGRAGNVDFHLWPLSFREVVGLTRPDLLEEAGSPNPALEAIDALTEAFLSYLMHGGYLTAINDVARDGSIHPATLRTYSDWIRGDLQKRQRSEHSLREVLGEVMKRQGSQVTYNKLASELSIQHPSTVSSYVELLEVMDVLFVQQALREDRLTGAPKKARKISFVDPFIHHAVRAWLHPSQAPFTEQIRTAVQDPVQSSRLAESCVASHFMRRFPTYYIKGKGEVDVAYVDGGKFWPVEVKWQMRLKRKELAQILKYENSRILARTSRESSIEHVSVQPLPLALLRLDVTKGQVRETG